MKMLVAGLILLVTFPPLVGSAAATIATAPHLTPAERLFPWVPAGGYPDRFPYGWCTWWPHTTAMSPGTATQATGSQTLLHKVSRRPRHQRSAR